MHMAAAGAQFNYAVFVCVDAISYISMVCVCLAHTHTHATTNSLQHPHAHAYEQSRMHSKGNMYMCVNTAQCTHLTTTTLFYDCVVNLFYLSRPQVERQYPPNLSILISGGKETNRDSLSSGERSGRSPSSESGRAPSPCPELWSHGKASLSAVAGRAKVPWKRAPGRVTAPSIGPASRPSRLRCCTCPRVGLFGNAALSGW